MDGGFKAIRAEMSGEFKAVKEEIRGFPLPERAENGLDARLELIQWGLAIFIAPLMIPLLIYFAKRAWDEAASFQFSVKRCGRASAAAADDLSRAKKQPSTKNDQRRNSKVVTG